MKIITINVNKGGAGKTTFAYNFAEYLRKEARVLLFDFDDSANLTNRYGQFKKVNNTIISLFDTGIVEPICVGENLDLIAGHREVELLKERVQLKRRREYLFGKWIAQNQQWLEANYDYLIIDTENDEGILTQNAIIVSDLVVGVAEAGKDSFLALASLRSFVDDLNDDFEENVEVAFVANKINLSEKFSKELLEDLQKFTEYVGYMPRRTILANEKSVFSLKREKRYEAVIQQVSQLFSIVKEKVDRIEVMS